MAAPSQKLELQPITDTSVAQSQDKETSPTTDTSTAEPQEHEPMLPNEGEGTNQSFVTRSRSKSELLLYLCC